MVAKMVADGWFLNVGNRAASLNRFPGWMGYAVAVTRAWACLRSGAGVSQCSVFIAAGLTGTECVCSCAARFLGEGGRSAPMQT